MGVEHGGCPDLPRITPLEAADDGSGELARLVELVGYRPRALLTMARRPHLLGAVLRMVDVVLRAEGQLEPAFRFLLACEAARHAGNAYTSTHLAHAAHKAGASWAQIWDLPNAPASKQFTPAQQALIALAQPDALDRAGDQAWRQARAHWNDDALAEAVAAIGLASWFTTWNRLVQSALEDEPAKAIQEVWWLRASDHAPKRKGGVLHGNHH